MYLDDVVVAGIIILVLTCIFLVVIAWFVRKHILEDAKASSERPPVS